MATLTFTFALDGLEDNTLVVREYQGHESLLASQLKNGLPYYKTVKPRKERKERASLSGLCKSLFSSFWYALLVCLFLWRLCGRWLRFRVIKPTTRSGTAARVKVDGRAYYMHTSNVLVTLACPGY
jgi:hypothetical protein